MSRWTVQEDGWEFCIQWYDSEEGDLGAYLGDGPNGGLFPAEADDWERAHNIAICELQKLGLGRYDRSQYYKFETMADAKRALAIVKAAQQAAKDNKPWPNWALQAKAAGWKPPKGWTP